MSKTIRFLVLTSCLALSALLISSVNAQVASCETFAMNAQDCELVTSAIENTTSAGAVAITFSSEDVIVTGFFDSTDTIEDATGVFVYDADGIITSARVDIPTISSVTSFSEGSNALSFILVDNIIYIGIGETLDELTWQQLPESTLANDTFTINSLINLGSDQSTAPLAGVDLEWERSEVGNDTVLSTHISDIDPFAILGENEEAAAIFGDSSMSGNLNASITIAVNNDTNTLSNVIKISALNYTIGSLDVDAMLGDEASELGEMSEEDSAMFGDLLGSMFGDSEQTVATTSSLGLSVDAVDTSIIVAPAEFEPTPEVLAESVGYLMISDVFTYIKEYYSEYSIANSFSFDFSDWGGDEYVWDFGSAYYYNARCEERQSTTQGEVAFGTPVTNALTAGGADIWTFNANEGDIVTIALSSDAIDSYLEIIGVDGVGLASDDDSGGYSNALITNYTLEQAGTYQISVCAYYDTDEGDYTLSLSNS